MVIAVTHAAIALVVALARAEPDADGGVFPAPVTLRAEVTRTAPAGAVVMTVVVQNNTRLPVETSLDQSLALQFMAGDAAFDLRGTRLAPRPPYVPATDIDRRYAPVTVQPGLGWTGTYRLDEMVSGLKPGKASIPFAVRYRYRFGTGAWQAAKIDTVLEFEVKP